MNLKKFSLTLFLLSIVIYSVDAKTHEKINKKSHVLKEHKKKEEEAKKELSKLQLKAKRMMHEGEGHRDYKNISGKVKTHYAKCPVCDNSFQALYVERQLSEKGMDPDLCKHSKYPSAYDFNLWCCSRCGYSHYAHLFHIKPKAFEDKSFEDHIRKKLKQLFIVNLGTDINKIGFSLDQRDIPTYIKYHLCAQHLYKQEYPPELYADFHLKYSWVHRIRFGSSIVDPSISLPVSVMNEQLVKYAKRQKVDNITSHPSLIEDFLMQLEIEDDEIIHRALKKFYLSKIKNRMGNPHFAMKLIKEGISLSLNTKLRNILIDKKRILTDEFNQSKLALKNIKIALQENAYKKDTPQFIYIAGMIHKRLGLNNTAYLYLSSSQNDLKNYSEPLYLLAQKQIDEIKIYDPDAGLEIDRILIHNALRNYHQLLKSSTPAFRLQEVQRILIGLEKASMKYFTELDFDPQSLKELKDVGLLSSYPELDQETLKYFKLKILKDQNVTHGRFLLSSTIPFEDENGLFWPSIQQGKLKRTRY